MKLSNILFLCFCLSLTAAARADSTISGDIDDADSLAAASPAATPAPEEKPLFGSQEMLPLVHKTCGIGTEGALKSALGIGQLVLDHPVSFYKAEISQMGQGPTYTENYLDPKVLYPLQDRVHSKLNAAKSCYASSGAYLRYESIGTYVVKEMKKEFANTGAKITDQGSSAGISDEIVDLAEKCGVANPRDDQDAAVKEVAEYVAKTTGQPAILDEYVTKNLLWNANSAAFEHHPPQSCEELAAAHKMILDDFVALETAVRSRVKKLGYGDL
ncbi:MAG: hypothetical protein ACXVB9_01720 [Bdellovibrionota bacterium]